MKLLFISEATFLGGGAEYSLYHLLQNMKKDNEIRIVVAQGDYAKKLKTLNLPLKQIEMKRFRHSNPLPFLKTVFRLKKEINSFDPDWVIANGFNACEHSCLAAKLAGKRFCYFVRDFPEILNTWLRKLCFRQTDLLIANSQAVKKELATRFGLNPKKIRVSYPPIDLKKFRPLAKTSPPVKRVVKEFGLEGSFVVGCFSRLSREKRQDLLIEAVKRLKDQKIKLLIVGDSKIGSKKFEEELLQAAKPLGKNCIFTGFKEEIVELINACDVIVFPSKKEPFGRVIVEAMACSKPVIATKTGGPKEVIKDRSDGLLVEASVAGIRQGLKKIKSSSTLKNQLAREGRKKAFRFAAEKRGHEITTFLDKEIM